ncbi:hypothetical protein HA075_23945 [bacterium BFN5]|nr:hypothetical protein HA075_23945 [bacterium BFN5]
MKLKTVYGPPPKDAERIEAVELEAEDCIREIADFPVAALVLGSGCQGINIDAVLDVLPDRAEQPHKKHLQNFKDKT